jgi:hypothetical protein
MKKIIAFAVILISLLCSSCEKCVHQYEATDPRISSCFFKVGSYFIYSDTTDHIIDSQYVFLYSYQPNSVVLGNECSTYANEYNYYAASYRNGIIYDTVGASARASNYLCVGETEGGANGTCYYPDHDTAFNNFDVSGKIYPTVYKSSGVIYQGNNTIIQDYYFASGYGVVKKVQHWTTGDVSWDLIRYHILK